jgi:hypothetical protein
MRSSKVGASLGLQSRPSADKLQQAVALHRQGKLKEAENLYNQIMRVAPDDYRTLHLAGVLTFQQGQVEKAEGLLRRALKINPDYPEALSSRGIVLKELNRLDEALACYDRATTLRPDFVEALFNRGNVLRLLQRYDEAIASFGRALAINPAFAQAHTNDAFCRLTIGDFEQGWVKYAWRAHTDRPLVADVHRFHRKPLPADLTGCHIVVQNEQGLGDELYFLRFAPALRSRGATVTYLADPRLVDMLCRSNIVDRVAPADEDPGPFDFRLTVGDLPWLLGMGNSDTPPPFAIPALAEREEEMRSRLKRFGTSPHVGITWRAGSATFGIRQIPLDRLAAAIRQSGATPVVVQRAPAPGEIPALAYHVGRPVLDLSAHNESLEDMLALMGLLDFYVGVDNTNQHLRVARGRTSHMLISNPPDFRWMGSGVESPWFPGTRVYRQDRRGDWTDALAALTRDLKRS